VDIQVTVHTRGVIFSPEAYRVLDDMVEESVDTLAEQGYRDIQFTLSRVLRNPTGFYQSQIRNRDLGPEVNVLYDNRVVYGPWLEGTSSRNSPVTSFPGYHTFRRVGLHLDKKATQIIGPVVARHVRRLS
jgi:hypothetical protein